MALGPAQIAEAAMTGLFGDPAAEAVLAETAALFHRMRHEAELIHGQGEFSSGRRAVLMGLAKQGPQTVPEMARIRPVSRQYMQRLVNDLLADGMVETTLNPAHKRSSLIALTPSGRQMLERMSQREQEQLVGVQFGSSERDLKTTARTLQRMRETLEDHQRQRRAAAAEES